MFIARAVCLFASLTAKRPDSGSTHPRMLGLIKDRGSLNLLELFPEKERKRAKDESNNTKAKDSQNKQAKQNKTNKKVQEVKKKTTTKSKSKTNKNWTQTSRVL